MVDGFVRRPVDRPLHRWVIVPVGVDAASADDAAPAAEVDEFPEDADEIEATRDREPVG